MTGREILPRRVTIPRRVIIPGKGDNIGEKVPLKYCVTIQDRILSTVNVVHQFRAKKATKHVEARKSRVTSVECVSSLEEMKSVAVTMVTLETDAPIVMVRNIEVTEYASTAPE